ANEQILALDQKLAIVAGVRADRSSANGDRAKHNIYPRASGSYRFTDLGSFFNEVKVRGGIARTGNRPRYADRDVVLAAGTINGGELRTAGVEAALSAILLQRADMDLNLRATFTKNKQDIQKLPSSVARFPAPGSFGAAYGRNFISPGGKTTWIWGNVPVDAN